MDPTLAIAIGRLGLKLGIDLVRALKSEGWNPTDEDLTTVKAARVQAVAVWDALAPD